VIGAGDVQWMTAGRGIVHEEYHSTNFTREGGTLEMCQLWVNLPKKHKMTKPSYQAILRQEIPTVELPLQIEDDAIRHASEEKKDDRPSSPLATVRLIAGGQEAFGDKRKGPAKTFSPVQMWDVNLPKAGSQVDIPYPPDQNCIVFVRRGAVQILSGNVEEGKGKQKSNKLGLADVAIMHLDGSDMLRIHVDANDTSLLIMGGVPLNEPIAAGGPMVMNTQEELRQAMVDYRSGKF